MENQWAGLREPTHEMLTDRVPTTRALPIIFRLLRERLGWTLNWSAFPIWSRKIICSLFQVAGIYR